MISAEKARELANDFEKRKQAKEYVEDRISPQIEEQAVKGNTELIFEMCKPGLESFVISELESSGYYVKKIDGRNLGLWTSCIISW